MKKEDYVYLLEFKELLGITEQLESKARYARTIRNYLLASLYEGWIDSIKNCEVSVEDARRMLQASKH